MTISATTQGLRPGVCTSSNRPATPFEGQMIYETDTDLTYVYGGSAWQQVAGGTAVGNSGLVYIAGGTLSSTAVNFVGCFTSEYRDYKIVVDSLAWNATGDLYYQFLTGTTPYTNADHFWAMSGFKATGVAFDNGAQAQTLGFLGTGNNGANNLIVGSCSWDIYGPQVSQRTLLIGQGAGVSTDYFSFNGMNAHNVVAAYTGIRLLTNSATTFTGNVTIYGYRK